MTASWSGEEWQNYCRELLAARHGADYQPVPDTVWGDWGIEGYTSSGIVYQCYAPDEPLTNSQLYEKQRDKMTVDLGKLRTNVEKIAAVVAPSEIRCWVLLAPRVEDKAILEHGAKKAGEIRGQNLLGVSDEFVVRVHTAADFPTERRLLDEALTVAVPQLQVGTDDEVAQFAVDEDLEVGTLDEKLSRLLREVNSGNLASLRLEFLRHYVVGRQLEDWIRRHHPALWERWQHSREGVKRTLRTTELTSFDLPNERLRTLLSALENSASSAVPSVKGSDANSLAWGTISTWLLECPLDFSEAARA